MAEAENNVRMAETVTAEARKRHGKEEMDNDDLATVRVFSGRTSLQDIQSFWKKATYMEAAASRKRRKAEGILKSQSLSGPRQQASIVVAGKGRVHYIIGVAAGARGWIPKRGPCTVHGGAVGLYGCNLTPDLEESGKRISGVVIVIVGNF